MDVKTVTKVNEAIHNILNNIETEMCIIDFKYKEQYQPYFDEIEKAIVQVADKFYQDYVSAQVIKNEKI
jgi:hypothetical protein